MTVFPQEPHESVGGCTTNLTQTTQVRTPQVLPVARVQCYYYVPSLAIRGGSLSHILPIWGWFVDTLVLQVIACLRAPTHEVKHSRLFEPSTRVCLEGAGQRACTVPTSTTKSIIDSIAQVFKTCKRCRLASQSPRRNGTARWSY